MGTILHSSLLLIGIMSVAIALPDSDAEPVDADEKSCNVPVPMIYAPVCGSDGVVYSSSYEMRAKNICEGTDIQVVSKEQCPNFPRTARFGKRRKRAGCNVPVPMVYMPVCGSNEKMYDNEYYLRAKNQCDGTNIRVVDRSRCTKRRKRSADDCKFPVPMIYMPVCGSDGITYTNKYLIRGKNACDGTNIVKVDSSNCPDFPSGAPRRGKRWTDTQEESDDWDDEFEDAPQ